MIATGTAHTRPAPDLLAPPLTGGARVDVCIVGASLPGLVAAYLLARERRSVMVVDEGPIGGSPAIAEAAHLASVIDPPYRQLEQVHGAAAARVAAQGCAAAIDAVETIVRRERIACDFERLDGYGLGSARLARGELAQEVASARRAGVRDVELVATPPIEGADDQACVRHGGQAVFHPTRFLAGLARAISREGGRIHCGVRTRIAGADRPATLVTSVGHRIDADVVVQPGAPAPAPRPVNVVGLRIARGALMRALYWDDAGPLRCARLRPHGSGASEVLLVAGEEDAATLAGWARERFPRVGEVVQHYGAELAPPADLFAVCGHDTDRAESLYVSTATWGTAWARAAIAGMAIRDFVESGDAAAGELDLPSACYLGG